MASPFQTFARATAVHVTFAFIAMGGWTLFANRSHGWDAAWTPALAQGTLSGLITLVLKRVLEAITPRCAGAGAYLFPPLLTASAILGVLIAVHRVIGTPEIAMTIAVPWSASTLYAILYTAVLARTKVP